MRLFIILLTLLSVNPKKMTEPQRQDPPATTPKVLTIEDRIVGKLTECGVGDTMAWFIVAQAKHESGNFKSKLFREHNNAFGMRFPRVRPTTAAHGGACAEGKTGYASYCSVEDSAEDVVRWLEFNSVDKNIGSIDKYVKVLRKKKYFTDKESKYLRSLKKIYEHKLNRDIR